MNKPLNHGAGGGGGSPSIADITLRTEDVIEANIGLFKGPSAGLLYGPQGFYLGDTPLVSKSGGFNFNPIELHFYHGDQNASMVDNVLGGTASNSQVGVNLQENVSVVRVTPTAQKNQIDVIELRFYIQQLAYISDEGDQRHNTLKLNIEYREEGSPTWLDFVPGQKTVEITGRITGAVKEILKKVPRSANNWEIRVTKLNPDFDDYSKADVQWESYQTITQEPKAYDSLAITRVLSSASEQIQQIPSISGIYGGYLVKIPSNYDPVTRHYTGTWDGTFKDGYTDNPAWCLYDLLMNPEFGAKRHYPLLQVDRYSFYTAAQWCDTLVPIPGGTTYQPRYTFNLLINEARPGLQMLHYVAGSFGAVLSQDAGGTVVLKLDAPDSARQIFGPESISAEGFVYQYTDVESRPNSLSVQFTNPDLNWQTDIREVELDEYVTRNGRTQQDFVAVGCIDVHEAQRRAHLRLLQANKEVCTVTFKTARQAVLLEPFNVVGIVDPDQNWGLSGRVKSVSGTTITLRDALTLPTATNITLTVQTPTGPVELTVQSATAYSTELVIQGGGTWPTNAPDRAQFSLAETAIGFVKPFRVLTIAEDENDANLAVITAVEIDTNKYGDADNFISTATQSYQGTGLPTSAEPYNIRVSSGTSELKKHADGTIESRIRVEWDIDHPGPVTVRYRRLNKETFQTLTTETKEIFIPQAETGAEYVVELVIYNTQGNKVYSSEPLVHQVLGKDVLPAVPVVLDTTAGHDTISLRMATHPDLDFSHFKIYGSTAGDTTLVYLADNASTMFVRRPPPGDLYTRYKVSAVDTSGNESAPVATYASVVPQPSSLGDLNVDVQEAIDAAATSSDAAALAAQNAQAGAEGARDLSEEYKIASEAAKVLSEAAQGLSEASNRHALAITLEASRVGVDSAYAAIEGVLSGASNFDFTDGLTGWGIVTGVDTTTATPFPRAETGEVEADDTETPHRRAEALEATEIALAAAIYVEDILNA